MLDSLNHVQDNSDTLFLIPTLVFPMLKSNDNTH
jgi:hypothetical protein